MNNKQHVMKIYGLCFITQYVSICMFIEDCLKGMDCMDQDELLACKHCCVSVLRLWLPFA